MGEVSSSDSSGPAKPGAVLPSDRDSFWRPGIPGGIPTVTAVHVTIDASRYGTGESSASAAINAAIQAAGDAAKASKKPQVVFVPKGVYRLDESILLNRSNVVLRGAGPKETKLLLHGTGAVIWTGWVDWPVAASDIVGTVAPGASTITVATAASFQPGDIVQIDQLDDPAYVYLHDAWYGKRAPGWTNNGPKSAAGYRSVTSLHEVTGVAGTTVTFDPPTRIVYQAGRSPQVWRVASVNDERPVRRIGIEDLYVTGGENNSIALEAPSYSWIRNVESDGSLTTGRGNTGMHISISHGFRCEVQRAYVHHARQIVQGGGAYGISLNASTSETLVENSIAVFLNKGMQTGVSGGGNVFGYNYIDNVRTGEASWMEGAANGSHQAFSHHDLWEGNYVANMGSDSTHGNSGFLVFFRNFAAGRCGDPAYFAAQTSNLRAANADGWMREMTFVGNVLHAPVIDSEPPVYEVRSHSDRGAVAAIWRIGMNVRGEGSAWDSQTTTPPPNAKPPSGSVPDATFTTKAFAKLWRHGNWDSATNSIADWQKGYARALPNSLYLSAKPAFFGSHGWPWVDPAAAQRVRTLPAKERYDKR